VEAWTEDSPWTSCASMWTWVTSLCLNTWL